jgi:fibronectin-binding autotransporter adhesin
MYVPHRFAVAAGVSRPRRLFPCWIRISLVAVSAIGPCGSALAANGTWSSAATTGAWQTTTNWVSHIVPGATSGTTNGDTALFNSNSTTNVIVPDTNRNLKNITFDTSAAAYTIGTTSGHPLLLTSGGTIQIASTLNSLVSETINAPLALEGNYNFSNNYPTSSVNLTIGGAITSGVAGTQALTISGSGNATISGALGGGTGTIAVIKTGAGTAVLDGNESIAGGLAINAGSMNLSGNNTFSGGVEIDGGTLQLGNVNALGPDGTNAVKFGSASTGTLNLNGNSVMIDGLASSSVVGTPVIQNANPTAATLTVNNSAATLYAGVLQDGTGGGSLSLIKAGAGTLTLSGNNKFTGGVVISSGGLALLNAGALNATTPNVVQVNAGANLALQGFSVAVSGLQDGGATAIVQNAAGSLATLTINIASSSTTYAGVLQDGVGGGALLLAKSGAGTQVLSGNNTFTGGVLLLAGTLIVGNNSALGTGNLTANGGTLQADGNRPYTVGNAVGINLGANLNVAGANSFTLSGPITASGGLIKGGSSTLTLTHAESLAGSITVDGGTLSFNAVSGSATIGAGVTATVSSGAALELAGSVSALSSGSNRVNIVNSSSTPAGVLVSGTHQQVGNIDGSGITQVNAGSDLTANHIVESAFVIGGTAASHSLVTIDASDSSGNPLDLGAAEQAADGTRSVTATLSSGLELAGSLQPSAPIASGAPNSSNLDPPSAEGFSGDPIQAEPGAGPPSVPEPSAVVLALLGLCGLAIAARRAKTPVQSSSFYEFNAADGTRSVPAT